MNKAFVREPELDGRAYCPRCGSLGVAVGAGPLDHHILPQHRAHLSDSAFFCDFARCEAVYFDHLERVVTVDQLKTPIYPKDPSAVICACFGFTLDEVEADVAEGAPTRIRALLAKSKTDAARCGSLAVDGQCCMSKVQRLYMQGISKD
ncbi:MAG: hypothetical protein RIC55_08345 [Pirellulaceae bacterium]